MIFKPSSLLRMTNWWRHQTLAS